ncbi:MAG: S8 family serine peptidase [Actinobacteria bacterium]|nr:S8 family serine peptidase [Actinomycetota bacterium]MBU1942550.1 S8 family serine peptidase [Actinomycetota bacterium]MBU2687205.1 S8 family serine peptidase [Actinomycetota bacterium]
MGKRATAPIACFLVLVGLVFGVGWNCRSASAGRAEISGDHVPGEVIVKFKPAVAASTEDAVLATERLTVKHENERLGFKVVDLPGGTSVAEAVADLSADPRVEYAEPNYIDHVLDEPAMVPDDPLYPSQWHMHGFAEGGIDAQTAWDTEEGDPTVIVAVVDTGVAYENYGSYSQAPDLAGTTFVSPYDAIDLDGHPNDTNGHGTHVTGTIAQTTNNALGCAGAAHGCTIMPVRGIGTHSQMADAYTWATDHGADVINYSGGGSASETKRAACQYAYDNGVTICAATGNDNGPIIYPAAYDLYCIAVGATDRNKNRAWYSNYGPQIDVVGPGGDTTGGSVNGVWQQTYVTEDDPSSGFNYQGWQGTSMATPHVSATAALYISNSGIINNPDAVRSRLQTTAHDLGGAGWDQYFGYGLVDANLAVIADNPVPVTTSISPDNRNAGAPGFTLTVNGAGFVADSQVRWNGSDRTTTYISGNQLTAQIAAGDITTAGSALVTVFNPAPGGGTSNVQTFDIQTPVNPAPSISSLSPDHATAGGPGFTLTVNGTGFIGDSQVSWNGANLPTTYVSSTRLTATVPAASIAGGGAAQVCVSNPPPGGGESAAKSFSIVQAASEWYLAEGTTGWGFDTYVSIVNPNDSAVNAQVTYNTTSGPMDGGTVNMPPESRATVYPRDVLGEADFSTTVTCAGGKPIAVDRTMTWTGTGAAAAEEHSSIGVTAPATTWYLPEGSSAWGFETWLLIQNPGATGATCQVTYMLEGEPPVTVQKGVPAGSRQSFNIAEDIGTRDASISVVSDAPVIPERAMYKDARREGHDSIGTTTPAADYYLAEGTTAWGFTTYVLVQNPQDQAADVTVTYMTPEGALEQPAFSLPANSRKTIRVNDVSPAAGYPIDVSNTDFSTRVHASKPIIAERAMYWESETGQACHDSIGMSEPHATFYLPDGQAGAQVETWTLVQNPNGTPVEVEVTYLSPDGTANKTFTVTIPANSRSTFNMADQGVDGRAGIMVTCLTPGAKIMAERAMYFDNRSGGTDTIGGYSD